MHIIRNVRCRVLNRSFRGVAIRPTVCWVRLSRNRTRIVHPPASTGLLCSKRVIHRDACVAPGTGVRTATRIYADCSHLGTLRSLIIARHGSLVYLFIVQLGGSITELMAGCILFDRWSNTPAGISSNRNARFPANEYHTNMQTIVSATQINKIKRQYINLLFTTLNAVVTRNTARHMQGHAFMAPHLPNMLQFLPMVIHMQGINSA